MRRAGHTAQQIIYKFKTAEQVIAQVKPLIEACRVNEVTQPTYHRSRQN